jgi:hypothetical protein
MEKDTSLISMSPQTILLTIVLLVIGGLVEYFLLFDNMPIHPSLLFAFAFIAIAITHPNHFETFLIAVIVMVLAYYTGTTGFQISDLAAGFIAVLVFSGIFSQFRNNIYASSAIAGLIAVIISGYLFVVQNIFIFADQVVALSGSTQQYLFGAHLVVLPTAVATAVLVPIGIWVCTSFLCKPHKPEVNPALAD